MAEAEEKDNNKMGAVGVVVMVVDLENALRHRRNDNDKMRMKINGDDYHNASSSSSAAAAAAFLQSHHTIPYHTIQY